MKPGAIVKLKSGGLNMTIEKINHTIYECDKVQCVWFDSCNKFHRDCFPEEVLKEIEEEKD